MVTCERKADFFVELESAVWGQEYHIWRAEWVVFGEDYFSDVDASFVISVQGMEHEVPFEDVALAGLGDDVVDGLGFEF